MTPDRVARLDGSSVEAHLGALPRGTWIRATHTKGDAVLALGGEFDMASGTGLRQTLAKALAAKPGRVVVDLSEVSFLDARTLGEFVRARNSLRDCGADLVLRSPAPLARRVLRVVGLADLVADDLNESGAEPMPTPVQEFAPEGEPARELLTGNRATVAVEQAKGLIAEHFGVGIAEAEVILRDSSRRREQSIGTLAAALVERTLTIDHVDPDRPAAGVIGHTASRVT